MKYKNPEFVVVCTFYDENKENVMSQEFISCENYEEAEKIQQELIKTHDNTLEVWISER